MQTIQATTPHDDDGSHHLAYTNSDSGVGATTPGKDGHQHQLIYDPPRPMRPPAPAIPPQIDPMTGMPALIPDPTTGQLIPDPGTPEDPGDPGKEVGEWIVAPAEDGHTHELQDIALKKPEKPSENAESERLEECMALWREAAGLTADSCKKGRESEDFYEGKQWDDSTARWLQSLDRANLTLNEIAPNIDMLIGYQMEQRTDIRYLPQEGGDQRAADMYNVVTKRILDNCYYQREETKVFKDQCVPGKGDFHVYMDFTQNIQGEIKVERFPWDDLDYGPHEKEDLSDCEYAVQSRMQSIAWLTQRFGKKAKEIETNFNSYRGIYPDSEKGDAGVNGTHTDYRKAAKLDDSTFTLDGSKPLVDVQKKQFRLAQLTQKIYKEVTVIFNQEEEFFFTAYDWKDDDIALASTLPGFQVVSQMKPRMRITKFCGGVILSDENPADLPLHDFYTIPVYGYRQNGSFWGKVEAAKDPQRELNKRRSQIMDESNRLGGAIYYQEPLTFKDSAEAERFKKNRSRPGSVFTVNSIDRPPRREEGAEVPQALVSIMQMDQQNLQRLMNVVVQQEGANEPGTLFLEKKKSRLTGNQFLFDNLSFAKQKLGKILLALIQRYYDAERCLRILNAQYDKNKFQVGGQDFSEFTQDEVLEILSNTNATEYDVIVTESSFSQTTRLGIAKMLLEAIGQGAGIDPMLPIKFLDMPEDIRREITDGQAAQQEQQAAAAAATSDSEVKKTLVAKGQYTVSPEEAARMGLVPANNPLPNGESPPNNVNDDAQATEYADNLASSLAQ